MHGNAIINWLSNQGTLKFNPIHMNAIFVEIREAFKFLYVSIIKVAFKATHNIPLLPPDQYTNTQDCLPGAQLCEGWELENI